MFVTANLARHLGFDPESALSSANGKFVRRFERIEAMILADGRRIEDLDLAQLDQLWDRVKQEEAEAGQSPA